MNGQDCEQLTLFPAASPASPFPWLESKKVKGMTATSGLKCSELSESLRRVGYSVRTYLESCELPPGTWSRTWSARALTSRCLILKLRLSARSTGERESRLLPTVTATVGEKGGPNQRDSSGRPGLQMAAQLWPTPQARDWKGPQGRSYKDNGRDLPAAVLWPTPTTRDYKDGTAKSCANVPVNGLLGRAVHLYATPTSRDWKCATAKEWDNPKNTRNLNRQMAKLYEGEQSTEARNGQLNPTWVEWLMGFPLGWTDLNASETP